MAGDMDEAAGEDLSLMASVCSKLDPCNAFRDKCLEHWQEQSHMQGKKHLDCVLATRTLTPQ